MTRTGFALSATLGALLALTGSAAAQDAFLQRFKAVMEEQGTTVSWGGVDQYDRGDGRPVIALSQVNVGMNGESTTLPVVELIDVTEEGGGWRVGTLLLPAYSHRDGEASVFINQIEVNGMVIEPEGGTNEYGGALLYESASVDSLVVNVDGLDVFTLDDAHVEIELPENGEPMRFSGAAESFTAKPGAADDPKTKAVATAMGYGDIAGYFEIDGEWDPATGRLDMARFDITVEDAGTIGLSLTIGGYTPEFIASLRETQARLAANPGGDNSAAGLAMMGLAQQLTLHSAQIRFDDDTLTEKVLEFAARQQGARSKDVANQAKAMVPFMTMQLGNAELTAMATTAVSAFLDNPESLMIAAQPAAPVPFALIMAGAMTAPQALPQQLGVTIKANE